ncbi:hypothetical protein [Hydrocarboniphaga sp.]|uniref:hypothetical protein n=1 Tax=Hydrocarboniphaga sp. TaxID=2033016 RepID=UPI003D0E4020
MKKLFDFCARAIAIALLAVTLSGCAGHKQIEATSPDVVIEGVNVGDEVSINSKAGKHYRFVITKITNKALYGEGVRVTYAEMSTVETRNKDGVFKRIGNLF